MTAVPTHHSQDIVSAAAEGVTIMDAKKAQILTEEISRVAFTVTVGLQRLRTLVSQAKTGNAHIALGYPSWPAYLVATLNDGVADGIAAASGHLTLEERRELVAYLAGEGMSSRAIAELPFVQVSDRQVRRDLDQVGHDVPPDEETPDWRSMPSVKALDATTEKTVVGIDGLDGKRYRAAAPKPKPEPKPKATPGAFWDATYELRKKLTTLENIVKRANFPRNRKAIREQHLGELIRYSNQLKAIISALTDPVDGDGPQ